MNAELRDLIMKWEGAAECLSLLEGMNASGDVLDKQRARCRELRAELNRRCPDNPDYDPHEFNVVEQV